jgi:hypothetical protein
MNLKIGDKVIMSKEGFHFHHNPDIQFDMCALSGSVKKDVFISFHSEILSLLGIGTVKRFNSSGEPYIRWENKMNGMYFFYEHYFEHESIHKIGLFQRLRLKLKALL